MDQNEREPNRYRRTNYQVQDLLRIGMMNAVKNNLGGDDSEKPRSLKDSTSDMLMAIIVDSVSTYAKLQNAQHNSKSHSGWWANEQWIRAKVMLQVYLPRIGVLDDLFEKLFSQYETRNEPLRISKRGKAEEYAYRRQVVIDKMDGKDLFLLWWLFVDGNQTRNLRALISHPAYRKFNHELVGFLANTKVSSVTRCTLQYNWILKMDYITALSTNLPNLRHVIFYCEPPTDDLLNMLAENCRQKLWKVEFVGNFEVENAGFQGEISNHRKFHFPLGARGKLTAKGYQKFFEKQDCLREIELIQVEKALDNEVWTSGDGVKRTGYNPHVTMSREILASVLNPLKQMKQLKKVQLTHNYVEMLEEPLPQVEQVELNLTSGFHPLEDEDFLFNNKNISQKNTTSTEDGDTYYSISSIPIDDLLPTDMNKLENLRLEYKFPGVQKLTLSFRIFAAAKYVRLNDGEENPDLISLGLLNTAYTPTSVSKILQNFPSSLHIRMALVPRLGLRENRPCISLFNSFDTFFMESLCAVNKAETIMMTEGAALASYEFRLNWIRVNAAPDTGDWGGWSFGLKKYLRKNGQSIEGHLFTKIQFSNLTVLNLNFGDQELLYYNMRKSKPPVSHDIFCQLFFLSDCLRKLKLTIPGGIAKFDEKDFIGKCNTVYGRQKLAKLNQVSLWFSTSSVTSSIHALSVSTTILSVTGFLSLLKICSKENQPLEKMAWFNVTGDDEKRFLREYETEGIYLPCVTHLLNQFVPMVAVLRSGQEGNDNGGWMCSDLRRAAALTNEQLHQ